MYSIVSCDMRIYVYTIRSIYRTSITYDYYLLLKEHPCDVNPLNVAVRFPHTGRHGRSLYVSLTSGSLLYPRVAFSRH